MRSNSSYTQKLLFKILLSFLLPAIETETGNDEQEDLAAQINTTDQSLFSFLCEAGKERPTLTVAKVSKGFILFTQTMKWRNLNTS